MNYLAKNLTYCRRRFDITQTQLALQLKRGQTTIAGWEKNVSEPNIEGLQKISEFFGISIDHLINNDLEKGNLITESHVKEFQKKGNLIGKPISNLKPALKQYSEGREAPLLVLNEDNPNREWVLARMIQENGQKLDQALTILKKMEPKQV
jgi:transcriptional regulator with XRE-family HTH domain